MKYHIISIGIAKYLNSYIRNLRFADKDAVDFFTLFSTNVSEIGFNTSLINEKATLNQIKKTLGKELKGIINKEDAFFFFYSGHGATAESTQEDSLSHYLVPYDATKDIPNSSISLDYIKTVFNNLNCSACFIFIDCCFSGAINMNSKCYTYQIKKNFKKEKTFQNIILGVGSAIFTASKHDEEALEDFENKHGLFTYFLLKELQKPRPVNRYPVSEIFDPIANKVLERAKEVYDYTQTPTLNAKLEGSVYLPVFKKTYTEETSDDRAITSTFRPIIDSVIDNFENVNINSYAKGLSGDWSSGGIESSPEIYIGDIMTFTINVRNNTNLKYRFQYQPPGGSFITIQDWSNLNICTWKVPKNAFGKWLVVNVQVRKNDEFNYLGFCDDYTYMTYIVLSR